MPSETLATANVRTQDRTWRAFDEELEDLVPSLRF